MLTYPFSEAESSKAYDEWGANCGPNALAFALQCSLGEVRPLIPGFEEKRYTSPSMMAAALRSRGQRYKDVRPQNPQTMFHASVALVRIQWEGPWTQPGANPRWAYRQTHWVTTWTCEAPRVFDVNGGIMSLTDWKAEVVPVLVAHTPRATGGWFPTHIWRLVK